MRGIELSREYYELYGVPMIDERFPEFVHVLAVGLCGSGSECFGYDDDISRDHDFDPGFCIFVPDTVDRADVFKLERAYASLPREFRGLMRHADTASGRRGVILQSDFFASRTGHADGALTMREWLRLPEHYLAEATNGAVFRDDDGTFTARRAYLSEMPADVQKKKLAGNLLLMSQSGHYNYARSFARGDRAAAQLAAIEYARRAMAASFNLDGRPQPFYKWAFRAFSELSPELSALSDALEYLITTDNDTSTYKTKLDVIHDVSAAIVKCARERGFVSIAHHDLTAAARDCNDKIADADVRNLNILYAVD